MNRLIIRGALGVVALAAVGAALAWSRPDLLAALARWRPGAARPTPVAEPAPAGPGAAKGRVQWIDDGWCAKHKRPEADCPLCRGQVVPEGQERPCLEKLPVIRLASPAVAQQIGLQVVSVIQGEHVDTLIGNAEVVYNANTYAEVSPRVRGIIREILTDEGRFMKKGEPLVVIDSAEVGSAKAAYLAALPVVELARATLERTQSLTRANALPMKDELEASTALNRARADLLNNAQRLRNLGFTDADLDAIAADQDTSSLLWIVAPIDGTIVKRHAVTGEAIEPTAQLFALADTRVMWTWIDVYENEIERVRRGQPVKFQIAGVENQTFEGHVDWIDTAVNPSTRTIRVRAELANVEGRLRANQFGRAEIVVSGPHQALFIPKGAVQVVNGEPLVFIPQADGSYHPQRIVIEEGENLRDEVEVNWGLRPSQEVVTTRSFELKSEMLRDKLAAGE